MALHESLYGTAGRKPTHSVMSGKALGDGDGAVYFEQNGYRLAITALEFRRMSAAEFEAYRSEWQGGLPRGKAPDAPQDLTPDYDSLTLDWLKALATKRAVDITGRRSKADVIQALRIADVNTRLALPVAEGADAPGSAEVIGE